MCGQAVSSRTPSSDAAAARVAHSCDAGERSESDVLMIFAEISMHFDGFQWIPDRIMEVSRARCPRRRFANTTLVTGLWNLHREDWPSHSRYQEGEGHARLVGRAKSHRLEPGAEV